SSCFLYCSVDPRLLHSFPTRRSSDLDAEERLERSGVQVLRGLLQPRVHRHHARLDGDDDEAEAEHDVRDQDGPEAELGTHVEEQDRKSTRLNSSHVKISYAVFCLKKK